VRGVRLTCYIRGEGALGPDPMIKGSIFTVFGRLELEWCERKILLGWLELELELVAGVV